MDYSFRSSITLVTTPHCAAEQVAAIFIMTGKGREHTVRSVFRRLEAAALLMVMAPGSAIAGGYRLVITDFQGPDPYLAPVTECLDSWFSEMGLFQIFRHEGPVPAGGSFEQRFSVFAASGADMVLHGNYAVPSSRVVVELSASVLTGILSGQTLSIVMDHEGAFLISELVPGSAPPARARFLGYLLGAYAAVSNSAFEQAGEHLDRALELESEVGDGLIAFAFTLRSLTELATGNIDQALEDAERGVALDPDGHVHYSIRGAAMETGGYLEGAYDDYRQARNLGGNHPETLYNLSRMQFESGDSQAAIDHITQAIALSSDDAAYHNFLGFILNHEGEHAVAVQSILRALEIDPGYAIAWANLGCARRDLGDLHGAVEAFTRAIEIQSDPVQRGSYIQDRGRCHRLLEDYHRAITDYREAIALTGGSAYTKAMLGWMLMQTGSYREALTEVDAALEMSPGNASYLGIRGRCNYWAGNLNEAVADFLLARQLDPQGFDDYEYLGKSLAEAGDYPSAIEEFTSGFMSTDVPREKALFLSYRAKCHLGTDSFQAALADLAEALELYPENPYLHYQLGNAYYLADMESDAIPAYDRALEMDLDEVTLPHCLFQRGRSHQILGNTQAAIRDFTETLAVTDSFFGAYFYRGIAYYDVGDHERSREDLTRYISVGTVPEQVRIARAYLRQMD